MPRHLLLLLAAALLVAQTARAQEPPAAPDAPPALDAPAADAPADTADADDKTELAEPAVLPPLENSPAVEAALELPRKEPADYMLAITALLDLGRPELAKPIFDELVKQNLTDVQRRSLVAEFGSSSMLQIARTKELAPAGAKFADACMAAAAAENNDPKRIAALVTQLTGGSAEERQLAINDLAVAGELGAVAVLEAAAKETNLQRRASLLMAAAQIRPFAAGPLLAMLDTTDPALRSDVAAILTRLRVAHAAPLLATSLAESSASAERVIQDAISRAQTGPPPFPLDATDRIQIWQWDDATKKLASVKLAAEEARTVWLARLARELAKLGPQHQTPALDALELESAALLPNPQKPPAVDQLQSGNIGLLNNMLTDALKAKYPHAAAAIADAIGKTGDAAAVYTIDGDLSPLTLALADPNRRVRFAALRAIIALDPDSAYPGSSRVPDALAWFSRSRGEGRALVAMPTLAAATNLAGMLAAHKLEGEGTNRGRDLVDIALATPDLEFIFIDMNTIVPDIRQVLYELRTHATTAEIPIALMAAEGRLLDAEKLSDEHQRVLPVSRPHSPEVLANIMERLAALAGREPSTPQERRAQAADAKAWLDKLRGARRPFYTIRTAAFENDSQPGAPIPPPPLPAP